MKVADLISVLSRQRGTDEVVVAGHGRLLFVTHAWAETGGPVCVLYVEEPHDPQVVEPQPAGAVS